MLEFSWQAFAFAVANFLLLVWLLARFLHKPLINVLNSRRERIEQTRQKAEQDAREAQKQRSTYERKLAEAAEESEQLLAETRAKAGDARDQILNKAREEARREVNRMRKAYENEHREALRGLHDDILAAALDTANGVLTRAADQTIEDALFKRLLTRLDELKEDPSAVAGGEGDGGLPVRVLSARELDKDRQGTLSERIRAIAGDSSRVMFETDASLAAGVRVEFSSIAVDATLGDVLAELRQKVGSGDAKDEKEEQGA